MKCTYKWGFKALCPVDSEVVDEYTCKLVTSTEVRVEDLLAFTGMDALYTQEKWAELIANRFIGTATVKGAHSNVSVKVVAP